MRRDEVARGVGRAAAAGGIGTASSAESRTRAARLELERALAGVGLRGETLTVLADAAVAVGAAAAGEPLTETAMAFVPVSVRDAEAEGVRRPTPDEPGSVDFFRARADRAQVVVEVIEQVAARLDGVRVLATAEGVTAMARAELARRGRQDASGLSDTARERLRGAAKSAVRQELGPAMGWAGAATATLVAVATAPVAFRGPCRSALSRGTATWPLVRAVWRACDKARLSAVDAAHVATVLLADEPGTCVPERLRPDGSVTGAPWGHAAFYAALEREVVKVAACPDPDDEASVAAAEEARRAKEAAYAARSLWIRVDEEGMASVTLTGRVATVIALGDRLDRAARAARGAGDPRTVAQLANDIGLALLGHATVGAHELPDLDIFGSRLLTPEDLATAGWTPQVIAALSDLPPAVLQVVVPLLALHDPATAHELPGVGLVAAADVEATHTGRPGCPGCLPSARARRQRAVDATGDATGESCVCAPPGHGRGECSVPRPPDGCGPVVRPRVTWVGRVLGRYGSSIGADLVRQLALSPGSTLVRLLVDPADGRCVERTTGSYAFDAAMRAQLAAADVTCRAPGCLQPAGVCQADHVTEHGTPGGETREANGQLVHVWHHQAKTAKAWDAVLHANRDVTWTTLLSRVYRTRVHDYRELVTLLVAAHQRVAATAPEGLSDQVDAEVYTALCYRGPGERLHEGDDDPREEDHLLRFGGWGLVSLSHRDPVTGRRVAGPSPAAQARGVVAARSATERVRRGAERLRRDEGPPPF